MNENINLALHHNLLNNTPDPECPGKFKRRVVGNSLKEVRVTEFQPTVTITLKEYEELKKEIKTLKQNEAHWILECRKLKDEWRRG